MLDHRLVVWYNLEVDLDRVVPFVEFVSTIKGNRKFALLGVLSVCELG
ncbi:MAG: hypothetical protein GWQ08_10455 [Verrucomicrobiaceae bacterium]|nr:hypothetical protein [Verrucomicrobiaceae bacterium]